MKKMNLLLSNLLIQHKFPDQYAHRCPDVLITLTPSHFRKLLCLRKSLKRRQITRCLGDKTYYNWLNSQFNRNIDDFKHHSFLNDVALLNTNGIHP